MTTQTTPNYWTGWLGFTLSICSFIFIAGTVVSKIPDSNPNLLTVKGLVEKTVPAEIGVWNIHLKRVGSDVKQVNTGIRDDKQTVLSFLKQKNITEAEISESPVQFIDRFSREYASDQDRNPAHRYSATTTIQVTSSDIEKIKTSYGSQDLLLEKGVLLDSERENGQANPRYLLPSFNTMRPLLLNEATVNAKDTAEQMIKGTHMHITEIHLADQGNIQILGEDGKDESDVLSSHSPVKRIRLVSTFKFKMKKD